MIARVPNTFTFANCEVDDACRPAVNHIGVEVELASAPKLVVGVHENVPPPPVPHEVDVTEPDEVVVRHWPADAPSPEMMRLVDEAVPKRNELPVFDTEKSVVVADAVDEPIAKSVVLTSPLLACIAKRANGVVLPMPI